MVYIEGIVNNLLFGVWLTRKGLEDGVGGFIHKVKKQCPKISIHNKLYLIKRLTGLSGLAKLILTPPEEC